MLQMKYEMCYNHSKCNFLKILKFLINVKAEKVSSRLLAIFQLGSVYYVNTYNILWDMGEYKFKKIMIIICFQLWRSLSQHTSKILATKKDIKINVFFNVKKSRD